MNNTQMDPMKTKRTCKQLHRQSYAQNETKSL